MAAYTSNLYVPTDDPKYVAGDTLTTADGRVYTRTATGWTLGAKASSTGPLSEQQLRSAPLAVANTVVALREAFETYDTAAMWSESLASGDLIMLDGNTAAASYLTISKDPWSAGTETAIMSRAVFSFPSELIVGLSMSQRTLGQEFSMELVSDEPSMTFPPDLQIATMSQATTTLTVTTITPHNLKPGMRVAVRNCADSRFNYPNLVVATTPSATQFTATSGAGGVIPSLTAGPVTSGFVVYRSTLGGAPNGTNLIFENATATQASSYVRSEAGDALPSGTLNGNHSITVGSTASLQPVAAAAAYCFQPTTEYRCVAQPDMLTWMDSGVDAVLPPTLRQRRSQVCPDHSVGYRLRFRAVNSPSLTRPVARILSVSKSGTTTATVTTDIPHGLTTSDVVVAYGARDTGNFANITAATAVLSVPSSTTFTVAWGAAVTATSAGGVVARVNGGQGLQGVSAVNVSAVSRTGNLLTLTSGSNWTGFLIGDYVNVEGVVNSATNVSVGVDGTYRVRDVGTTSIVLEPIGSAPTGVDIALVNAGGTLIKRTDLRISYARVLDYERQRVEMATRAGTDQLGATPVSVTHTVNTNVSNTPAVNCQASVAEDSPASTNPITVGGVARNALPLSSITQGDSIRMNYSVSGQLITKEFAPRDLDFQVATTITTATQTAIRAAQAAGVRQNVTSLTYQNTSATATLVTIQDGSNTLIQFQAAANMANPVQLQFPTPLFGTAATALNYVAATAGANVLLQVTGFNSY